MKTVLVIEDHADVAAGLQQILELLGHRAVLATSGKEALAAARQAVPDLVLCDVSLPDMDGYDVARAFRSDPLLSRCRLIALTAYDGPERREMSLAAGFDQHIVKPPDLGDLEKLLEM